MSGVTEPVRKSTSVSSASSNGEELSDKGDKGVDVELLTRSTIIAASSRAGADEVDGPGTGSTVSWSLKNLLSNSREYGLCGILIIFRANISFSL